MYFDWRRISFIIYIGLSTSLVPLYLSEIAPASWKGVMGVTFPMGMCIGVLVSQIMGMDSILGKFIQSSAYFDKDFHQKLKHLFLWKILYWNIWQQLWDYTFPSDFKIILNLSGTIDHWNYLLAAYAVFVAMALLLHPALPESPAFCYINAQDEVRGHRGKLKWKIFYFLTTMLHKVFWVKVCSIYHIAGENLSYVSFVPTTQINIILFPRTKTSVWKGW